MLPRLHPPRFHPWIGENYTRGGFGGVKILIVGESHYSQNPEDINDAALTQKIVTHYCQGEKPLPFFKTLSCLLMGRAHRRAPDIALHRRVWRAVAFYNYLQVLLPGPRCPLPAQVWEEGQAPFRSALDDLTPDIVLVAGKRLSSNIPAPQTPAVHIRHPAAFGFSYAAELAQMNMQLPASFAAARANFMAA